MSELIKAAKRMIDLLTVDGEPSCVAVPPDVDAQEFTEAFNSLAMALRDTPPRT